MHCLCSYYSSSSSPYSCSLPSSLLLLPCSCSCCSSAWLSITLLSLTSWVLTITSYCAYSPLPRLFLPSSLLLLPPCSCSCCSSAWISITLLSLTSWVLTITSYCALPLLPSSLLPSYPSSALLPCSCCSSAWLSVILLSLTSWVLTITSNCTWTASFYHRLTLSAVSINAPLSKSNVAMAICPYWTAHMSAVEPFWVVTSVSNYKGFSKEIQREIYARDNYISVPPSPSLSKSVLEKIIAD
jgi:hypothetical protein